MIARLLPGQRSWIVFAILGIAIVLSDKNYDGSFVRRQASSTVRSTFLVVADSEASSYSAYSGLNNYGIPYEVLTPDGAVFTLPILNVTTTDGNYGGIVVMSDIGLNTAQWNTLYAYQTSFGVRLVRLNGVPSSATGTKQLGSCCSQGQEQTITVNDTSGFPTAGLVKGAALTTVGLYHYPAAVTNSKIATAFLQFGVASGFSSAGSVGGVINNISGRQQMVFFIEFATEWSSTSVVLQHAWIHWATRGLYAGFRRIYLNTQVDDVFLISAMYSPSGSTFRIRPADFTAHISWMSTLNAKLPKGSNYTIELGHNGNGNIGNSYTTSSSTCPTGPISYAAQSSTELEFKKPLGTGTNLWPATSSTGGYPYSLACAKIDSLEVFFSTTSNRDAFCHVSHTFTHENENNATYFDVAREISWNQAWFAQTGLANAKKFSPKGVIPPAITGLHNGDALRAWSDYGIVNAVGDNTRPALSNTENEHWPLITNVATDGFAGIQVTPRWASNIYYNCDTTACDVREWNDITDDTGTIADLLALEKQRNVQHLLALRHDAFMFHQANMRQTDVDSTVVNGVSGQYSLLQMWVETVTMELSRITTWPLISLKHDDLASTFASRMARDKCNYTITYAQDPVAQTISAVTVSAAGNTCSALIPVTVPGTVTDQQGFRSEKIGSDPLTIWVKLSGAPVVLTLGTPVIL